MVDPAPRITESLTDEALARALLRIKAVAFSPEDPYTWASGLLSPIYCDNRRTLGYPEVRRGIAAAFDERLAELDWSADVIAGTATAGIPHAAWLAERLDKPMVYVRSEPKGHGKQNQIEGVLSEGDAVVLVEDLVSTGGSALGAVKALRAAGASVVGVLAIFTYGLPEAAQRFAGAEVGLSVLTTFEILQKVAAGEGLISSQAVATVRAWQRDPSAWSDIRR